MNPDTSSTSPWNRLSKEGLDYTVNPDGSVTVHKLTPHEGGKLPSVTSLVPQAKVYHDQGFSVLISGRHGCGKTESVRAFAEEQGLNVAYFSCGTLDPYTDLVGVPTPRMLCTNCKTWNGQDATVCSACNEGGSTLIESLRMVRPHNLDEADIVFFDELNRADPKVINALLEIVQFRSINGERLPKLKSVWAAINPPGGKYEVESLDPAIVSRFHIVLEMQPRPSVPYLTTKMREPVAQALVTWWEDQQFATRPEEEFISPRDLMTIGLVFEATGNIRNAIAPWINCERGKLTSMLAQIGKAPEEIERHFGSGPNPAFAYTLDWVESNKETVVRYLRAQADDLDTHRKVAEVITKKKSSTLMRDCGDIVRALAKPVLEAWLIALDDARRIAVEAEIVGPVATQAPVAGVAPLGPMGIDPNRASNVTSKSGRGPSGQLRNFGAMDTAKFQVVANNIIRENNDSEAIVAVRNLAASKGLTL